MILKTTIKAKINKNNCTYYQYSKNTYNSTIRQFHSTLLYITLWVYSTHLRPGPQWMVLEFDGAFVAVTLDTLGACHSVLKLPAEAVAAGAADAAAVSITLITYSELLGGTGSESDMSSSINISSDISSASYLLLSTVLDCSMSGAAINNPPTVTVTVYTVINIQLITQTVHLVYQHFTISINSHIHHGPWLRACFSHLVYTIW